ncbi:hypothetical protein KJ780_01870 [Candidatus Micrarchaeota archaeon]|nr:hypothetical protein [Candidatus Micrarchaeota archaeon]
MQNPQLAPKTPIARWKPAQSRTPKKSLFKSLLPRLFPSCERPLPPQFSSLSEPDRLYAKEILAAGARPNDVECAFHLKSIAPKEFRMLWEYHGIRYFSRYFTSPFNDIDLTLVRSISRSTYTARNTERPFALCIFAQSDYNGALNETHPLYYLHNEGYRIGIFEVNNPKDLGGCAATAAKIYGPPDLCLIEGHGSPSGIQLSNQLVRGYPVRLTNMHKSLVLQFLQSLADGATVALLSCSTGQEHTSKAQYSISKLFALCSDELGKHITIFAPLLPSAPHHIIFGNSTAECRSVMGFSFLDELGFPVDYAIYADKARVIRRSKYTSDFLEWIAREANTSLEVLIDMRNLLACLQIFEGHPKQKEHFLAAAHSMKISTSDLKIHSAWLKNNLEFVYLNSSSSSPISDNTKKTFIQIASSI